MIPLLPLAAAVGVAYFLFKRAQSHITGKSGRKWLVTELKQFPSLAGTERFIEILQQGASPTVAKFRQFGSNTAYRLYMGTGLTDESPLVIDAIADFGLTVPKVQSSSHVAKGAVSYQVDILGSTPGGMMLVDVYVPPYGPRNRVLRFWQRPNDEVSRELVETDATTVTPVVAQAMKDFGLPPGAPGLR